MPVVFLLYWIFFSKTKNLQNSFVFIASIVFYIFWDWRFLGLLLITAGSTFFSGILLGRIRDGSKKRKIILVIILLLNLGVLFFFKYCNFFIQAFADTIMLFGRQIDVSTLKIILPVGISFYTFTSLSYTIDVYQNKIEPTKDVIAYLAYATFFPCILSGPISRAQRQLPQFFLKRVFDYTKSVEACKFILLGTVMKMCLADRIGTYVDLVYGDYNSYSGNTLLLTSMMYSLQIYADFAGYSLVAIGSGKLLGIDLPTNFIRPYFAKTITDFWRRWHISLTTWFRDYIYFPLGGNRCTKSRWILNVMIVFVISGLWHGAAYTFLIWGAMHGLFMVVERFAYGDKIKEIPTGFSLGNIVRMGVTLSLVNFAWIFFRLNTLGDVCAVISKIFTNRGGLYIDAKLILYIVPALIIVFFFDFIAEKRTGKMFLLDNDKRIVRWIAYCSLLLFVLLFGSFEQTQYIYFQF